VLGHEQAPNGALADRVAEAPERHVQPLGLAGHVAQRVEALGARHRLPAHGHRDHAAVLDFDVEAIAQGERPRRREVRVGAAE